MLGLNHRLLKGKRKKYFVADKEDGLELECSKVPTRSHNTSKGKSLNNPKLIELKVAASCCSFRRYFKRKF